MKRAMSAAARKAAARKKNRKHAVAKQNVTAWRVSEHRRIARDPSFQNHPAIRTKHEYAQRQTEKVYKEDRATAARKGSRRAKRQIAKSQRRRQGRANAGRANAPAGFVTMTRTWGI